MFPFVQGSPQEAEFKKYKHGIFLKNTPTFSAVPASDLATSMSSSPLVFTPMSIAFKTILDHISSGTIKSIDKDIFKFITHCREDSYLLENEQLDNNFTNHITTEM